MHYRHSKYFKTTNQNKKIVNFRVDTKDLEKFKNDAEKLDLNYTEYFIQLIYDSYIKKTLIDTSEIEKEQRKQGNNLNQIAHKLNALNVCSKTDIEDIKTGQNKILKKINLLLEEIKNVNNKSCKERA